MLQVYHLTGERYRTFAFPEASCRMEGERRSEMSNYKINIFNYVNNLSVGRDAADSRFEEETTHRPGKCERSAETLLLP